MKHSVKLLEDTKLIKGTSYNDWIVRGSKTQIQKILKIKPRYVKTAGSKCTYMWHLILDDKYPFCIYDMSYGYKLGKDEVIEYHIGWKTEYDNRLNRFPNDEKGKFPETLHGCLIIEALEELGLDVDHSEMWYRYTGEKYFNVKNKEELLKDEKI